MIVDDLNLIGIAPLPAKADAPLLVHSNAVLTGSISPQFLQSITRWHAKIAELLGRIHRHEFAQHRALEIRGISSDGLAGEQSLGITIGERVDHREQ